MNKFPYLRAFVLFIGGSHMLYYTFALFFRSFEDIKIFGEEIDKVAQFTFFKARLNRTFGDFLSHGPPQNAGDEGGSAIWDEKWRQSFNLVSTPISESVFANENSRKKMQEWDPIKGVTGDSSGSDPIIEMATNETSAISMNTSKSGSQSETSAESLQEGELDAEERRLLDNYQTVVSMVVDATLLTRIFIPSCYVIFSVMMIYGVLFAKAQLLAPWIYLNSLVTVWFTLKAILAICGKPSGDRALLHYTEVATLKLLMGTLVCTFLRSMCPAAPPRPWNKGDPSAVTAEKYPEEVLLYDNGNPFAKEGRF